MLILALETSTEAGSCALWRDGSTIARTCPTGRPHSETLLPLVRALLTEAGATVRDLDAIAFGAGPGAFTGLRVACGAAQGLAVAGEVPLLPVTSLETLAEDVAGERILPLLDARMGEVYWGRYLRAGTACTLQGEIRVTSPEAVAIPEGDGWLACGNALAVYPELAARLARAGLTLAADAMPTAAGVARIAARRLAAGEAGIDAADAAPLYVRDKVAKTVAERLREGGRA